MLLNILTELRFLSPKQQRHARLRERRSSFSINFTRRIPEATAFLWKNFVNLPLGNSLNHNRSFTVSTRASCTSLGATPSADSTRSRASLEITKPLRANARATEFSSCVCMCVCVSLCVLGRARICSARRGTLLPRSSVRLAYGQSAPGH